VTSSPSLGEGPRAGPLRLVLSTFPSASSAAEVAHAVVEAGLAACATALPATSVYRWKGKLEESEERLVIFKTSTKKVGALFEAVLRLHPYEVPELVELETHRVHDPYLLWVLTNVDRAPRDLARAAGAMRPRSAGRPPPRRSRSR
jgi:periplasmic divalent cation tolerance protein